MVSELSSIACHALGGVLIAAALVLAMPKTAHAFWYGGVWVEPGPAPYPYVVPLPPPPPFSMVRIRAGRCGCRPIGTGIDGSPVTGADTERARRPRLGQERGS